MLKKESHTHSLSFQRLVRAGCIFAVHPVTIEAIVSAVSLGDLLWHTVLLIMVQVQLTFWSLHDFTAVGRITLHVSAES